MPTPNPPSPAAVSIHGLWKVFGGKPAVRDLSFEVPKGCFFGLLGRNGAGKTTTIRMATALLRPDRGSVRVDGVDVWAEPLKAKSLMGVLPEDLRLFERLTGLELLTYTGLMREMDPSVIRRRAGDLLGVLELEDSASTMVIDFSHGMRKKIALAAALLHGPRVLFLDEPFEAVDAVSARAIQTVLERYTQSGSTVVFSSHVMDLVERLCDRVAILHQGELILIGPVADVVGTRTLDDVFIGLVGATGPTAELSWLDSPTAVS